MWLERPARALAALQATVQSQGLTVHKAWYEPNEVDQRAALTMLQDAPRYPDAVPPATRRPRLVPIQFVVDTAGHVDLATLHTSTPADTPFVQAVPSTGSDRSLRS